MKLTNLKKMFNHILKNVSKHRLKMSNFRYFLDKKSHKCNSSGCVIGHCVILDDWENVPKDYEGNIEFEPWSENFTGLPSYSYVWDWCFSGRWPDDKKQILLRLKYLIDNQKPPDDWDNNFDYKLKNTILNKYELC